MRRRRWTLQRLNLISASVGQTLRQTQPRAIKVELLREYRPSDYRGDVWLLTERDGGTRIDGSRNDHFVLRLNEHSGGGYLWNIDQLQGERLRGHSRRHRNPSTIKVSAIRPPAASRRCLSRRSAASCRSLRPGRGSRARRSPNSSSTTTSPAPKKKAFPAPNGGKSLRRHDLHHHQNRPPPPIRAGSGTKDNARRVWRLLPATLMPPCAVAGLHCPANTLSSTRNAGRDGSRLMVHCFRPC